MISRNESHSFIPQPSDLHTTDQGCSFESRQDCNLTIRAGRNGCGLFDLFGIQIASLPFRVEAYADVATTQHALVR